jgi:hypothetical protein
MGSWGAIISAQLQLHSPLRLWCLRFLQVVALHLLPLSRLSQTIKSELKVKIRKDESKKGRRSSFFSWHNAGVKSQMKRPKRV